MHPLDMDDGWDKARYDALIEAVQSLHRLEALGRSHLEETNALRRDLVSIVAVLILMLILMGAIAFVVFRIGYGPAGLAG